MNKQNMICYHDFRQEHFCPCEVKFDVTNQTSNQGINFSYLTSTFVSAGV